MKIRNLLKPVALIGAAAVLLTASGCGDSSWSFKTSEKTLSNGEWIYYTNVAYSQGVSKIQEDQPDVELDKTDIATLKIEDKDALDWIKDEATKAAVANLALEKLAKENNVVLDETTVSDTESQYAYYYNLGKDFYTNLGVSKESFYDANVRSPMLSNEVFKAVYGKGGKQEVTDDELNKYFTDNYTDYYYLVYSLKTTDEEGKSVDVDDETKDKITTNFGKYAKMLNSGEGDTAKVEEEYKTDFEATSVPSSSNVANLENTTLGDDLKKAITDLKEKTATVTTINDAYYMIYKGAIADSTSKITDDESVEDRISRENILYAMKNDDYKKFLEDAQAALSYETNDECMSKYSVKRTLDTIKKLGS